ncbi:MAG: hypothetical protein J0I19_02110 [Alphaproteobacteria bacterium]|nr:hypothetical protein [Alphaproteobacteria bacterium]
MDTDRFDGPGSPSLGAGRASPGVTIVFLSTMTANPPELWPKLGGNIGGDDAFSLL